MRSQLLLEGAAASGHGVVASVEAYARISVDARCTPVPRAARPSKNTRVPHARPVKRAAPLAIGQQSFSGLIGTPRSIRLSYILCPHRSSNRGAAKISGWARSARKCTLNHDTRSFPLHLANDHFRKSLPYFP